MEQAVTGVEPVGDFNKICEILDRFGRQPGKLVPILQEVQNAYRYLPEPVMVFVATALGIPPARVYGVATFYSHFTLEPKGKNVIRVCDGTACHVKGSDSLIDTLRNKLKLTPEQKTTPDMLFTLETVSCLGACGLAPVVVVNEEVHGQMDEGKVEALIEQLKKTEKELAQ